MYLGEPVTAPWPTAVRLGLLSAVGLLLLLAHALLGPAALSYSLMLDLRRRGRNWHRVVGDPVSRLARWRQRARWIDLSLPLLLTWLLFAAVWVGLDLLQAVAGPPVAGKTVVELAVLLGLLSPVLLIALPRWLHRRFDDRLETLAASLASGAAGLLGPLLAPLAYLGELLVGHSDEGADDESLPEDDLADVIEVGSQQGELSIAQSELLRRELAFARKTAADVMVPRVMVQYLDITMGFEQAREAITSSPYSRFPVQDGSVDNVVAVVHAKQFLRYASGAAPATLRAFLERHPLPQPVHVPSVLGLEDVLELLRRRHTSLAVVDDGYGGVAGILTVEDVVEELVGEIVDETDTESVSESFRCNGRRRLDELAEHGLNLPGQPGETVAEFLANQLPEPLARGQDWEQGGVRLVIDSVDADGGVETVRVEMHLVPPAAGDLA